MSDDGEFGALYDGGGELLYGGEYVNEADLYDDAQAPAAGYYKVYTPRALFRLGSPPVHTVFGRFRANAAPADCTHAAVIRRAWELCGVTADEMVLSDLAVHAAANLAECSIYITGDTTGADVCDAIAISCGSGWGARNADGKLRLVRMDTPTGPVTTTITPRQMPLGSPVAQVPTADKERGKPAFSVRADFDRNATVQSNNDLLPSVSAAARAYFTQEVRAVVVADTTVQDAFTDAVELVIPTIMTDEDSARDEAARVLAFRKHFRFRFSVTVLYTRDTASIDLFDTVGVVATRFGLRVVGLESGHPFLVLGVSPNAKARTITFDLWGNTLTLRNRVTRDGRYRRTRTGDYRITRGI